MVKSFTDTGTIDQTFYPEMRVGGFSRVSGTIDFFARVAALVEPTDRILDYGAGRGALIDTDRWPFSRWLKTLKGRVAHVEGCDVDPAVLENPFVDSAKVIDPSKPLPYPDASFDLVYAMWVLEHVDDPDQVAAEVMRVLKPGGVFCAMTPNKHGYVALVSHMVPNRLHSSTLRSVQPKRLTHDVFPTRYRLNTRGAVHRHFARFGEVLVLPLSGEPSYHFGIRIVYGLFKALHAVLPGRLDTTLMIFVRKSAATAG